MNTYRITGGYKIIEYRSLIVQAPSKEEAITIAKDELEESMFSYLDWEIEYVKELSDFEIVEIIKI
jgi:hypothetical protein